MDRHLEDQRPDIRQSRAARVFFAAAACIALAGAPVALIGCGAAPEVEAEVEADHGTAQEGSVAKEEAKATATVPTMSYLSRGTDGYLIANTDGDRVKLANPDWEPEGPMAEGLVLVSWEESSYDEEWDTTYDEVTCYGLVDKTGEMVVDLTDTVHAHDRVEGDAYRYTAELVNNPAFCQGRMALCLDTQSSGMIYLVIDTSGKVIFTLGDGEDYDVNLYAPNTVDAYHDGVLGPLGSGMRQALLDENGTILMESDEILEDLGAGFTLEDDRVVDYSGATAFDLESLVVEGDIEDVSAWGSQPGGGLLVVSATKVNPYGGADKELNGIYNLATEQWLLPLSDTRLTLSQAHEGLVPICIDAKAFLEEGYGAEDDDPQMPYLCLLDLDGNVVAESAGDEALLEPQQYPTFIQEGYWNLGSSHNPIIAHIEQGKVSGVTEELAAPLEGFYPYSDLL